MSGLLYVLWLSCCAGYFTAVGLSNDAPPSPTTRAKYKLTSFKGRGIAEPIRLMFEAAGEKYEDVRVTKDQWKAMKDRTLYGQLPTLEYHGKPYGMGKAIASFVAKECGLAGESNLDALRVDEVLCLTSSVLEALDKARLQKNQTKKAELQKKLDDDTIPEYLGYFERLLKENENDYFVGSALTQADLTVFDLTVTLLKMNARVLDYFPEIQKMRQNVKDNVNVKAYLDKRPDSDF